MYIHSYCQAIFCTTNSSPVLARQRSQNINILEKKPQYLMNTLYYTRSYSLAKVSFSFVYSVKVLQKYYCVPRKQQPSYFPNFLISIVNLFLTLSFLSVTQDPWQYSTLKAFLNILISKTLFPQIFLPLHQVKTFNLFFSFTPSVSPLFCHSHQRRHPRIWCVDILQHGPYL